jgi:hypothetical protein
MPDEVMELATTDGITERAAEKMTPRAEKSNSPNWLIRIPGVPDLLSPFTKRAVEVGFILGGGGTFSMGLWMYCSGDWMGMGYIVGSPIFAVMICGLFGGLAHFFQVYWHAIGGDNIHPRRRQIPRPPRMVSAAPTICTDITTRSPHVCPRPLPPALSVAPAEAIAEDDRRSKRPQSQQGINKIRIYWIVFIVGFSSLMIPASVIFGIEMPGVLWGALCFGLPCGFLLATLVMLLVRNTPAK